MKMRPYQQKAHDDCMTWVKKNSRSCVLELPTGAGKSIIVAEIASSINRISGKHVLCIVPTKELLEQNAEKIRATGNQVSLFSASVGETCLANALVVGTPVSIKNKLHRFGSQFAAVIIDECHKITPTVQAIIEQIKTYNPNLRVIGLSATPYRMMTGYIYKSDIDGTALHENKTKDPYFYRLVYQITARELINLGYLCQPVVGAINGGHYETLSMQTNKLGNFSAADVDRAYHGKGRLTSKIVADVVAQSANRKGVLLFAATVQHAHEIMESLPPHLSAIVSGDTPKHEREIILMKFKSQTLKYLVNVAVLTTGFDAPHCDVVAILRATESMSLLQQIIGRGLRLSEGKQNCMVLDYAENIERHCPDGDIFSPIIKVSNITDYESEYLKARCPKCNFVNEFIPLQNPDDLHIDDNGYFCDLENNRLETEYGFFPAHHGRACRTDDCDYKWSFKPCLECDAENDITARYCSSCRCELIDPNEEGVLKSLIKSTGGGVATAIDFVGSADSFSFGVSALRKSGKMICVGLFGGASKIVPAMVTMKSLSIEGSYVGSLQDMHDLMGIARSGVLPDMPLTIESLESSSKVLENLRQGNIRGRCILKC